MGNEGSVDATGTVVRMEGLAPPEIVVMVRTVGEEKEGGGYVLSERRIQREYTEVSSGGECMVESTVYAGLVVVVRDREDKVGLLRDNEINGTKEMVGTILRFLRLREEFRETSLDTPSWEVNNAVELILRV